MSLKQESTYQDFTNLVNAPDYLSATIPNVDVWANHVCNPSLRESGVNWSEPTFNGCSGSFRFVYGSLGPEPGTGVLETTVVTTSSVKPTSSYRSPKDADRTVLASNEPSTSSVYVSSTRTITTRIVIEYYDTGDVRKKLIYGPNTLVSPGEWVRLSLTTLNPNTSTRIRIGVDFGTSENPVSVGDTFRITCMSRTYTEVLTPYFDGGSENLSFDPDLSSVWVGTANNSPSKAIGLKPVSGNTLIGCVAVFSKRFDKPLLRLIKTTAVSASYRYFRSLKTPSGGYVAIGIYRDDIGDTLAANVSFERGESPNKSYDLITNANLPEPGSWGHYTQYREDLEVSNVLYRPPSKIGASFWYDTILISDGSDYDGPAFSGSTDELYYKGTRVFPRWSGASLSTFRYYPHDEANKTPVTTEWNKQGQRYFEDGIDRGVLYTLDGRGVPWNGLTAVEEKVNGGDPGSYYIDGVKYLNVPGPEEYSATLKAFTYPREFEVHDGSLDNGLGLQFENQPRHPFGLCYRTLIGNDVDGIKHAYKLHLIYNVLASPTDKSYKTIGDNVDPMDFSWALNVTPEPMLGMRPTAHLVVDSRRTDPFLLRELEEILYGTKDKPARLPTGAELREFFDEWITLMVIDHGDGTFTATGPDDVIKMVGNGVYEIDWRSVVYTSSTEFTLSTL